MLNLSLAVYCGGVFEQLVRYTTRYQESDLHLAFILLNLLTTSAYFTSTLLLLFISIHQFKYSSGFNSQSWTCLGQLTGRVSIVFLIANTATGLLLSGNRLGQWAEREGPGKDTSIFWVILKMANEVGYQCKNCTFSNPLFS